MSDIYDQHSKAFESVSAFVVLKGGECVAKVAFKFAKNGTRTTCYLNVLGAQMVRAIAPGRSENSTLRTALSRVTAEDGDVRTINRVGAFRDAVTDNGASWDQDLRKAGFSVWQAV